MEVNSILLLSIERGTTMKTLVKFLKEEKGLETVEWAVIAALIVGALVTVIGTLGDNVLAAFQGLETGTQAPTP
jgi:Flp pilus assembly pilin Flp